MGKMTTKLLHSIPFAMAIGLSAVGASVHAQPAMERPATAAPTPPGANGPAERAENAGKRALNATERGVKKAGRATKRAGNRAAAAVRNTGDKITNRLPPAPRDNGLNGQGIPREPKQ